MGLTGFVKGTGFVNSGTSVAPSAPATVAPRPPTLRAIPPSLPQSTGITSQAPPLNFGSPMIRAIRFNVADELGASVAPTATGDPNVGQPGSANNAGNIAGAAGNIGYAVETVRTWKAANPTASKVLKIGLPVAGVFLISKGHTLAGAAVAGIGAALWLS